MGRSPSHRPPRPAHTLSFPAQAAGAGEARLVLNVDTEQGDAEWQPLLFASTPSLELLPRAHLPKEPPQGYVPGCSTLCALGKVT